MATDHPTLVVIAGSDSSGGAGLQRDLHLLHRLEAKALSVVTSVTAQTNSKVSAVFNLPAEVVIQQIKACAGQPFAGLKIGMLGNAEIAWAVAENLHAFAKVPIVIDPVLVSSSGTELLDAAGLAILKERLCPMASLLTPNLPEAATLLGVSCAQSMEEQAAQARDLEARLGCPILLKGGHAEGNQVVDVLSVQGDCFHLRQTRMVGAPRGTGCALSSSITLRLAEGMLLRQACEQAQRDIGYLWKPYEVV